MTESTDTDIDTGTGKRPVPMDVDQIVIRFAGDSGDGMQLTGGEMTRTAAIMGNDLATFPDFPSEIRAPAGTIPGVSAFQLRFASFDIHTPGDNPDALVAMNAAALKVHLPSLKPDGVLIVNTSKFKAIDLKKAKYETNPLEDGSIQGVRVVEVDLEKLTRETLKDSPLDTRSKDRCKNMFALGVLYWLYHRDMEPTLTYLDEKFGTKKPDVAHANIAVVKAGYNFADISGLFQTSFRVAPAKFMRPGRYRNMIGNYALGLGLLAASKKAKLPIMLGSYPITPATDLLHQLSNYKHHGVVTFQAEDEIAAVCAAIGASYAGKLGVTTTSGPGLALKSEAIGLAVMTELPLVIVNVQRAGPSTGMPTKTEQADLLQSMFGRNGECPMPIVAASTPGDCFETAFEAVRLALKYMVPVMVLSDGYIANGSEPWAIPKASDLPEIAVSFATEKDLNAEGKYQPYLRDPETLARRWAIPGTPGLMHRIGGLEKDDSTGHISYDPANHQKMTDTRAAKVDGIANDIPDAATLGESSGEVLVLGWGSTRGAITGAVQRLQRDGKKVSACFLRHIHPFPKNLGAVLQSFEKVIIPELNGGQLALLIRAKYLVDAHSYSKVEGQPFRSEEIEARVMEAIR